jgi:anti-anti-sigma factor
MIITKATEGEYTVFELDGKLDTVTSEDLQGEILAFYQEGRHLILDFEKLVYVSSAGLRSLLIGQKTANTKSGSMTLRHVADNIMTIFKMTGFDSILTIEA